MQFPLILIGPIHAGKSTVANLLAKRWNIPRISMDDVRFNYYREIGYDEKQAPQIHQRDGFAKLVAYWKPFEAHAVERLLADRAGERCVIDFGAGHSVYDDPALFERVKTALAPYPVVLLLPSPDDDESLRILTARRDARNPQNAGKANEVNAHFVRHPSNRLLAKFTVYTKEQTPQQTAESIWQLFRQGTSA